MTDQPVVVQLTYEQYACVAQLLWDGASTPEIAQRLGQPVHTTRGYLHRAFVKMGVRSDREALVALLRGHITIVRKGSGR